VLNKTGPQSIHILRGVRQQQDEPGRFSICSRQAAVVHKLIKKIEVEEDYEFCVSLDKGKGLHEVRTFKSEREALDAYRILTLYGYTVTIEKKEGND
ncbi:hypothetical protein ACJHYP_24800, partial [Escherichia sp. WS1384]